jgi:8-oxo-dGTP pyrophosphatase MutT (NUDIX family)
VAENDVPHPSGTVVALRDAAQGLEVLLLQRARRPGDEGQTAWVFPGGKVEDADRCGEDAATHARLAAVREAREEAGLALVERDLTLISRWITPEVSPRRFDTWFFATAVRPDAQVVVDGMEIGDHRWLAPDQALAAYQARQLKLAPPTFVTITWLREHREAAAALAALAAAEFVSFRPRICRHEGGACILYPGDAGYEAHDPEHPGSRHRLWASPDGYRYERSS